MARQDERLMSDDTNGMMGAGMDATEQRENAKESPAGQDAMPKDVPATTLYSALRDRKSGMLESRQMQRAPFRAREFFAQYHGMTSEEIIDALAGYFVGFPLELPQKQKLLNALAQGLKPDQPVPVIKMAEEDLRATVQLLLSTAEYQVC